MGRRFRIAKGALPRRRDVSWFCGICRLIVKQPRLPELRTCTNSLEPAETRNPCFPGHRRAFACAVREVGRAWGGTQPVGSVFDTEEMRITRFTTSQNEDQDNSTWRAPKLPASCPERVLGGRNAVRILTPLADVWFREDFRRCLPKLAKLYRCCGTSCQAWAMFGKGEKKWQSLADVGPLGGADGQLWPKSPKAGRNWAKAGLISRGPRKVEHRCRNRVAFVVSEMASPHSFSR